MDNKKKIDILTPDRLDSITYLLITNHFCDLKDLKKNYNIYEFLDLYEACMIMLYNKSQSLIGG